jgi:uncharacterized protein (TIGR02594 family)
MNKGIEVAKKYLGLEEKKDRKKLMEMFKVAKIDLDPNTTPWCAAFVNGCEVAAGNKGNGKVNARSFLTYGKSVADEEGVYQAEEGDICVFSRGNNGWQGHVTYFVEWNDANGTVKVLGGNQSDKVCYAYYKTDSLLDIRRA